jgi:MSHA pilin protein MshA
MKFTRTLKKSRKNTQGFTLIELVVVIVILGILAATVAPKYVDLTAEAHTATLEAVKGSLEGASALVYSKSIVAGNQNDSSATITLNDGDDLTISYGHPVVPPPSRAEDYFKRLIDIDDSFDMYADFGGTFIIYPNHIEKPNNSTADCIVTYEDALGPNIPPEIIINPCI